MLAYSPRYSRERKMRECTNVNEKQNVKQKGMGKGKAKGKL